MNTTRKLEPYERLAVQLFAEKLFKARIKLRLLYKTPKGRYAVSGDKHLSSIFDAITPAAQKLAAVAAKECITNDEDFQRFMSQLQAH